MKRPPLRVFYPSFWFWSPVLILVGQDIAESPTPGLESGGMLDRSAN